jgi:hypothetical protein
MEENILEGALSAIKGGEIARGQRLLWQYLQADPQDEKAWLWLAQTLPDDERRLKAMEECLKHNPESQIARRAVQQLRARLQPTAMVPDMEKPAMQPAPQGSPLPEEQLPAEPALPELPGAAAAELPQPGSEALPLEAAQPADWLADVEQSGTPVVESKIPVPRYRPSAWVWLAIALLVILLAMVAFVLVRFYLPYYQWRNSGMSAAVLACLTFQEVGGIFSL